MFKQDFATERFIHIHLMQQTQ